MRILGIDPGLRITGYGVIDVTPATILKPRLVDGGVIRLETKSPLADRLVELAGELEAIITEHRPDICAVEQLYSNYAHPRTAILMGHARGVILLVARRHHLQVRQLSANRIKQSLTGHGHAKKDQCSGRCNRYGTSPSSPIRPMWPTPSPPRSAARG